MNEMFSASIIIGLIHLIVDGLVIYGLYRLYTITTHIDHNLDIVAIHNLSMRVSEAPASVTYDDVTIPSRLVRTDDSDGPGV